MKINRWGTNPKSNTTFVLSEYCHEKLTRSYEIKYLEDLNVSNFILSILLHWISGNFYTAFDIKKIFRLPPCVSGGHSNFTGTIYVTDRATIVNVEHFKILGNSPSWKEIRTFIVDELSTRIFLLFDKFFFTDLTNRHFIISLHCYSGNYIIFLLVTRRISVQFQLSS